MTDEPRKYIVGAWGCRQRGPYVDQIGYIVLENGEYSVEMLSGDDLTPEVIDLIRIADEVNRQLCRYVANRTGGRVIGLTND